MRNELFREVVGFVAIVLAASFAAVLMMAAGSCLVGGREQGPSEVLTETARAYSDPALVPAPAADDSGEDGLPGLASERLSDGAPTPTSHPPEPASTVTQSALTATAYTAIDPVPATPVATPARVETVEPQSIKSYEP